MAVKMVFSASMAFYEDARKYKIENPTMYSTGLLLEVKVLTWKATLSCDKHLVINTRK